MLRGHIMLAIQLKLATIYMSDQSVQTAPASSAVIPPWISSSLIKACDLWYAMLPQPEPSLEALEKVKIISHRGIRDNQTVFENSFAAFDALAGLPIWGIEFDIRWTKDLWPVVFHDPCLTRLYGDSHQISDFSLFELQTAYPDIPTLKSLAMRYGERYHLTIELKYGHWPEMKKQQQRLLEALGNLKPRVNFHLMSFDIELLTQLDQVPSDALLGIMHSNPSDMRAAVNEHQWAGLGGHYMVLRQKHIDEAHQHNRLVATGFPVSKNSLYREINRGVDWVFVDDAVATCKQLNKLQEKLANNPNICYKSA